jgi:hypothetical protein
MAIASSINAAIGLQLANAAYHETPIVTIPGQSGEWDLVQSFGYANSPSAPDNDYQAAFTLHDKIEKGNAGDSVVLSVTMLRCSEAAHCRMIIRRNRLVHWPSMSAPVAT